MKLYDVSIKGVSPLLMNRPDLLDVSNKAKKNLPGKDILEHQFETKQYRDTDGKLFIPNTHIRGSMVEAGKKVKVKGQGKATYSKIVGYSIFVQPAEILHKKVNLEKFIVLAVNPNTKGRNPLCRPMLKEWEADFQLEVDDEEVPEEVLKEILDIAGKKVGIGDWRPQKKGPYGRFMVTHFSEAK